MKKIILFFAFIAITTSGIKAQLLVESFDYPAGDSITSHGWTSFSGGVTNAIPVVGPGLDYPGYQLPGVGNAAKMRNSGQDDSKPLSVSDSIGSIYTFFIVNVDTARASGAVGDYFFGYLPLGTGSTTNYTCRVYIRKSLSLVNKFAFGISKNAISGGAVIWSDSIYSLKTNYLVCAKYTFSSATTTDDLVSLFVFSGAVPSIEPTPTLGPVGSTTTDVSNIGTIALRQGAATTASTFVVDEFYVGTDWGTLLPVELFGFSYSLDKNNVNLNWSTVNELNNSGFEIERTSSNGQWTKIGNVSGNGTSNVSHNYSFIDRSLASGKYNYRLKQIDFNGNFEYFNLNNEVNIGTPVTFNLSQNYPNPFNPSTKINFEIPVDGNVSLKVYNNSGKEVAALVNEFKTAGYYTANFSLPNLSSGVYFYTLVVSSSNPLVVSSSNSLKSEANGNNFTSTKKMLLVK